MRSTGINRLQPKGLCACILVLLAVIGCGGGSEPGTTIKIGAVFDLTGPTSDVGTAYADGLRGYVDWLNENGGIAGKAIELLYQDYAYKVDQAEQLYSRYAQNGVVAFQGWGTADTEALRGRIGEDEIPFMSASYSHVLGDPQEAPFNFLAGTSYTDQFKILLDWMLEQQETSVEEGDETALNVALMHNPSPFGLSPYNLGGKDYADRRGITLTKAEMPRGNTDFTAELTRIAQSGAQWVVFQNTSGPVATALKNAKDLGLDLRFACLNWCSNSVLTDLAEEAAEGVLGSVLFSPPGDGVTGLDQANAFLVSKGSSLEEEGLLYGQGWMTMHLMMEGVRRAAAAADGGEITGRAIKDALETLRDFDTGGVTSPVTFTSTNHRGTDSMRLFEVRDGVFAPLTGLRSPQS